MKTRFVFSLFILLALIGCQTDRPPAIETPEEPTATPGLPTPVVQTTAVPSVEAAAASYLDAWAADDYAAMYALLDDASKAEISETEFSDLHRDIAAELALESLEYDILSTTTTPTTAQVAYQIRYNSVLIGVLQRDIVMTMSLAGEWQIAWRKTMILPELEGENHLWLQRHVPSRGNIYDRTGNVAIAYAEAISLGFTPPIASYKKADKLLNEVSLALGTPPEALAAKYAGYSADGSWYIPLGAVSIDEVDPRLGILESYTNNGLLLRTFEGRYYFGGGVAPQTLGYVRYIYESEEDEYLRMGYARDEKIGDQGVERWGESYLTGTRGGTLMVLDENEDVVTQLVSTAPEPAQEIYTTIDKDFQLAVQAAMSGYYGAIVVLEQDTGRILAMASSPSFDPNAFNPYNYNSTQQLQEMYNTQASPLLNRATQGLYPLGSVFKIITASAALESGEYVPEDSYYCGYHFTELSGRELHDWTWDHFQEDEKTLPSGELTLPEGLMRSCNPWFWHIGLGLYSKGMTDTISEMARGFGLGSVTGIEVLEEETGNIPVPQSETDATNLAIGQGDTQVTPLQVAQFVAALGNGGTLYRPQIIESIQTLNGEEIYSFEKEAVGELPISQATMDVIKSALIEVVENPRGTAAHRFRGLQIPVAGKTGTAESGSWLPHAWFVGYTFANDENKPDIAVVVIAENAGEGSDIAAPIFRRVVELYFDQYLRFYPWEAKIGVWATPEP
ncbi:MAG: penicillin-binding transpeptidase domain-containing protein [Chloroflexota bacterium]|nr:penicillin-binding transpeptidase domain-containing protein [Chloroflexota bacterium]